MKANNEPSAHYLRFNWFKRSELDVVDRLRGQGLGLEKDADVEGLFRVGRNARLVVGSEYFRNGAVILQDKASVIAARILNARPGETVWDACAAPGMKTQLLWESMRGDGHLIATDMSLHRLRTAIRRAGFMGGESIEWLQTDASRSPVKNADKILIDAPCTSTGTLRRSPFFKWRLNKATLLTLMSIQNKILDGIVSAYSDRPGTEMVYATCSLLPHEGESQIDSLMSRFDIKLLDAGKLGSRGYPGFRCSTAVRRLFPHLHDTNGFFICRFTT
jgi:16S rRNA (cytosine967-C5)-methyltransferase